MPTTATSVLLIAALAIPAAFAGPDFEADEPEMDDAMSAVALPGPMKNRILKFATATLDELVKDHKCPEEAATWHVTCEEVIGATHSVTGPAMEGIKVKLGGCKFGDTRGSSLTRSTITVSLMEEVLTGNLRMDNVEPINVLPACVQKWLNAEMEKVRSAKHTCNTCTAARAPCRVRTAHGADDRAPLAGR